MPLKHTELATKKRMRHAFSTQIARRTKMININSPAESVYFVVVWKHFEVQLIVPCQAFTISFATEKAFADHIWTTGRMFCRPGISHLGVYFIYESSVASETKMRNAMNKINFRGSCFYITYNNGHCFTMLKILRSVFGPQPLLKLYLCPNATSQGFTNVSGRGPDTKSKFFDV